MLLFSERIEDTGPKNGGVGRQNVIRLLSPIRTECCHPTGPIAEALDSKTGVKTGWERALGKRPCQCDHALTAPCEPVQKPGTSRDCSPYCAVKVSVLLLTWSVYSVPDWKSLPSSMTSSCCP